MTPRRGLRLVLGLTLVATVAASLWPMDTDDAGVVAAVARASPSPLLAHAAGVERGASAPDATTPSALPERAHYAQVRVLRDPFMQPAPPPVRPASAPVEPPAPPPRPVLPWSFAGRLLVPGQPAAMLFHDGGRTFAWPVGTQQGDWRLDADAGAQLELTHLPSGTSVLLPLAN